MRANDDLVDLFGRENVLHRGERIGVEDSAVSRNPGSPQRSDHAVEPTTGCCATRIAVDDVSLAWLRDRRDDRDADRPPPGAASKGLDELGADERLVRDDEDGRGRVSGHGPNSGP